MYNNYSANTIMSPLLIAINCLLTLILIDHILKKLSLHNYTPLPVPGVSYVFTEDGLLYKWFVTKNTFAASDEVISFRINNQSYSLIGFNQYVTKKWLIVIVMFVY